MPFHLCFEVTTANNIEGCGKAASTAGVGNTQTPVAVAEAIVGPPCFLRSPQLQELA